MARKKAVKKAHARNKRAPHKAISHEAKKVDVKVFGIGGGGSTIVQDLSRSIPKVSFYAVDAQHGRSKKGKKISSISLSQSFLDRAADYSEHARELEKSGEAEKIKKALRGTDFCVFVASLGGKTTHAALPFLAREARKQGVLTLGVFTMPFVFEGETKRDLAKDTLVLTKPLLHASCVLSNEKIFLVADAHIPLAQALTTINKNVEESLGKLFETIFVPGIVNIDFADVRTTLRGYGRFGYIQTFPFQRNTPPEKILERAMKESLYAYTPEKAQSMLFHIAGSKDIALNEVHEISHNMQSMLHPQSRIIFGVSTHQEHNKDASITFLVSGCKFHLPGEEKTQEKRKKQHTPSHGVTPLAKKKKKKAKSIQKKSEKKEVTKKKPVQKKKASKKKASKKSTPSAKKKKTAPPPPRVKKSSPRRPVQKTLLKEKQEKTRKNALQVKKDLEEMEKEIVDKEKAWDIPAFLRKHHM